MRMIYRAGRGREVGSGRRRANV